MPDILPAEPSSPRPSRRAKLALAAFFLLLSPLAALILAEAWVRIRGLPAIGSVLERDPYIKLILTQSPRGIVPPTVFTTNRWGMRGDEPPTDWSRRDTWIAIGSHTTQCYHLDDQKTWSALLQRRLRVREPRAWVGNAGQDGMTSATASLLMETVIRRVRPKAVMLLMGGTDMFLSFSDERRERGSPYDGAFESRLAREMDRNSLKERSRLFREYNLWKRRHAHDVDVLEQSHQSRFPRPLTAPEDSFSIDSLIDIPFHNYGVHIMRIQELALAHGIRALFLTQPYLYGTDSAWASREARTVQYHDRDFRISAATERRILNRFNDRLLSLCAENRLECFDLAHRIPTDSAFFYDYSHLTEAGAEKVAAELDAYLAGPPAPP